VLLALSDIFMCFLMASMQVFQHSATFNIGFGRFHSLLHFCPKVLFSMFAKLFGMAGAHEGYIPMFVYQYVSLILSESQVCL
jgi:hypothetical protein